MSAIITLTGRLGADPEIRFSPSGTPIARLSVVTARRTKDDQGNWSDTDVTWWDCTAFRSLAENCAASLAKGMAVVAVGRAVQENWEDKQTGQKRSKIAVKLDSIGPDLTRATAAVQKANGQAQQGGQQRQQAQDPWASGGASRGGWGAPQQGAGTAEEPPF
jgi:single-strand DNA-binding protein